MFIHFAVTHFLKNTHDLILTVIQVLWLLLLVASSGCIHEVHLGAQLNLINKFMLRPVGLRKEVHWHSRGCPLLNNCAWLNRVGVQSSFCKCTSFDTWSSNKTENLKSGSLDHQLLSIENYCRSSCWFQLGLSRWHNRVLDHFISWHTKLLHNSDGILCFPYQYEHWAMFFFLVSSQFTYGCEKHGCDRVQYAQRLFMEAVFDH